MRRVRRHGGAAALIGKGPDDVGAFATLDEALSLGLTILDTAESYAGGASETTMRRWFSERGSAMAASLRITTKVQRDKCPIADAFSNRVVAQVEPGYRGGGEEMADK